MRTNVLVKKKEKQEKEKMVKFRMSKARLSNALKAVQSVVPSKSTTPILSNVKIDVKKNEDGSGKISFMATDLDLTLICDDMCDVECEGSTTLPVKLFAPAVSKVADGLVEVSVDESERASIVAGSASFRVNGIPADGFPELKGADNVLTCTVKQNALASMLKMVVFATSIDGTRRTLCWTLMAFSEGKVSFVATDGRRLATYETALSYEGEDTQIIVPAKTVSELLRSLNGDADCKIVTNGKNMVEFDMGSVRLISKLIDDAYPNYKQVIPETRKHEIEVDRQMLYDALDRVSLFSDEATKSCKLTFSDAGVLHLSSNSDGMGEGADSVPIKYSGEEIEIIFNPHYIIDILKPMVDDTVVIKIEDGHSQAIFKSSENSICVLMPLRIQ